MRRRITKGRVNINLVIDEMSTRQKKYTEYILHTMSVTCTDYNTAKELVKRELGFKVMNRTLQMI
jgi:hypothetical protein